MTKRKLLVNNPENFEKKLSNFIYAVETKTISDSRIGL